MGAASNPSPSTGEGEGGGDSRRPLTYWLWLLPDHVIPGAFFVLVTVAYGMTLAEYWRGEGSASGLDPLTQAWLVAQRAASTLFYGLVTALFIFRRARVGPHTGLGPALVALAGVWGLGGLAVQALIQVPAADPLLTGPSSIITTLSMVLAIVSLAYLGRCFGVFAEARGLVTLGPYRYVRHPLYLAEIIGGFGGALPTLSLPTVASLGLFVGFQYWRAIYEERALTTVFPEYADYARRTWRILPGIH